MSSATARDEKERGLARVVTVIRERWWAIVLTVLVVAGLAFGVSLLIEPRYETTAQLAYSADDAHLASQALSSTGTGAQNHNIASDALTLETSTFATRVSRALGGALSAEELRSSIDVTSDSEADVIYVRATHSDPYKVAEIANTYASEFVNERQERAAESLAEAQRLLEARIESLTREEASSAYGSALKQRHDDLTVLLSMQIKDYEVLQQAIVPASPYFPRPFLNLILGVVAGLILGLMLAFVLDRLDRRVKDQSTLERVMDLPIIGTMPLSSRAKRKAALASKAGVGFGEGNEVLLESMRMLRSNLKVLGFGESMRSVLVTSAAPGEGKSTLAVNLALSMALSGDRVILVDADLRNPTIHQYLDIPNEQGLSDALLETETSWSTRIQAVDLGRFVTPQMTIAGRSAAAGDAISRFLCLTSGPVLSNPAEVLESNAMIEILDELRGISDYVILDGPPMLIASDSLIVAQCVDAVVLASKLGQVTTAEALQVKQLLARAEITALGIVISGSKVQPRQGHYYYRTAHDRRVSVQKGA